MTFNTQGISIYFRTDIFFIVCAVLLLSFVASGRTTSQPDERKQIPVILISGLGGSILSENPNLMPCSSNIIKNGKQFKKEIIDDGFPKNAIIGNPANLEFDRQGSPRTDTLSNKLKPVGFVNLPKPLRDICDLSLYLQNRKYKRDITLFEFYYDFRHSVRYNAGELKIFIERIRAKFGYSKFNIIAHSMGGLVAKQYLTDKTNADFIDKLILVATPNLGSVWALVAIRYGMEVTFKLPFYDGCKVKKAFHNSPGFFNLLPGRKYFSLKGGYFIDGEAGLLNFEQTVFNLKNRPESKCLINNKKDSPPEKLSEVLLDKEFLDFVDIRDNWLKPPNVRVYVFAGYGLKTLKAIEETGKKLRLSWTTEGDLLVPLWSAESIEADKIFYINMKTIKANHISMIGKRAVKQNILSILQKGTIETKKGFSYSRP